MFVQWLWQWLTRNVKNAISFRWLWKSWKLLRRLGPRTDPGQGDTGGTLIASYNPQPSWSSTAPVVVCESRVPAMVPPIHIHSAPSNTNAEVTIYRPSSPRLLYPHRLSAASRSSPDLGPYSSNFSSASDSCSNLCVTPERPLVASRSCTTLRSDWGSVCSKPATSESEQSHTHGAHIAVPSRLSTGGETDANSGCSTLLDQDHRAIPAGECNIPFRKPRCIKPADVKRYHRNGRVRLRDYDGDPVKIAANTRLFPSSNGPAGWKPQTHVEGARYYLHSNKKYLTDEKLCDLGDELVHLVNRTVDYLEDELKRHNYTDDESIEVVLEIIDEQQCGYYVADNVREAIFWLNEYEVKSILNEVQGDFPPEHLALKFRAMYWAHYALFPNHREVSPETLNELQGYLIWYNADAMTSAWSTSPYSSDELRKFKEDILYLQKNDVDAKFSAPVIGRLMEIFVHQGFINYHDQPVARLASNQSILEHTRPTSHSWLFKGLCLVLLNAPCSHLRSLETVWVDEVVHTLFWNRLITGFIAEWSSLQLMATVLLAGNMSFLAIQSVDRGIDVRSLAQIASCYSTVLSIHCIILSLVLIRAPMTKSWSNDDKNANTIQAYLHSRPGGLKLLAVVFSLPYTLVFWALACLLVAFFCWSFQLNPVVPSTSSAARAFMSLPWVFLVFLVIWVLAIEYKASTDPLIEKIRERVGFVTSAYGEVKAKVYTLAGRIPGIRRILSRTIDPIQDEEHNIETTEMGEQGAHRE